MKLSMRTLLLAGLLSGASLCGAQTFDVLLSPEQEKMLKPTALAPYKEALHSIDRVDPSSAMEQLGAAASEDEGHIELQFLLAKYARKRAEVTYGEESLKNYDVAETALRRLLGNPRLGPEERARVRRESERVREGKEALRARDDSRRKDGYKMVLTVRDERLERNGINKKLQELREQSGAVSGTGDQAPKKEQEKALTKSDIWSAFAAPGLAIKDPNAPPQGFGQDFSALGAAAQGFGGPGGPGFGGFGSPALFGGPGEGGQPGADPFGGGGPPPGGAGFADPGAGVIPQGGTSYGFGTPPGGNSGGFK